MIDFMSSWAEQIVLAIIVATIIELILPKSKNKKYIQMIIGVYVLFNIISPIINNKEDISIEKYNIESYIKNSQQDIDQSSMDERIEKIYLKELEDTVTSRFEDNGCTVINCDIDAVLDTNQKNAGIHMITVKVKSPADDKLLAQIKSELVTEFEIKEEKIQVIIK